MYALIYHGKVVDKDIPQLDQQTKIRIKAIIAKKLSIEPEKYSKPLRKSLKGYRKLKIGNYRVVFLIQGQKVLIYAILHRSKVYQKQNRFK